MANFSRNFFHRRVLTPHRKNNVRRGDKHDVPETLVFSPNLLLLCLDLYLFLMKTRIIVQNSMLGHFFFLLKPPYNAGKYTLFFIIFPKIAIFPKFNFTKTWISRNFFSCNFFPVIFVCPVWSTIRNVTDW